MSLLPLRVLPVDDAPSGAFLVRVQMDARAAAVYVRRQADRKTWVCNVSSLQEILAPTQQARSLDLLAVVTCLYNGAAHDASGLHVSSVELVRREVAFTQPATWTGDSYRLSLRVAIRTAATAVATAVEASPLGAPVVEGAERLPAAMDAAAIAVVEPADEDVVFGFNFTTCDASIERTPVDFSVTARHSVRLGIVGVGFPLHFLNWLPSAAPAVASAVRDGVFLPLVAHMEATLTIVHMKGPVHFVLSVGVAALNPRSTMTYQPSPQSQLCHTVAQYALTPHCGKSILQVAVLYGSAAALEGTTLCIREEGVASRKTVL